jgi:hypothetical protein
VSASIQIDIAICCPSTIGDTLQDGMIVPRSFIGVDAFQSKNYLYTFILPLKYQMYWAFTYNVILMKKKHITIHKATTLSLYVLNNQHSKFQTEALNYIEE